MRLVDIEPILELVKKEHEMVQDSFNKANLWKEPNSVARYGEALQEIGAFIGLMINAPTVDAVPVIRCKNCQYWMKNPYRESSVFGLCFKHKDIAIATDETDWCSWAERRTE